MSISDLCFEIVSRQKDEKEADIITFCESDWGLGLTLTPFQRFVFKCFYGIELDNRKKSIHVWSMFRERVRYKFTEVEYLNFLRSENRISLESPEDIFYPRNVLVLVVGRRGSKTTSSALIAVYETYKLLKKYNPQQYYKILEGDEIRITNVSTAKDQAAILFNMAKTHFEGCSFFKPFVSSSTQSHIKFKTGYDRDKYSEQERATIKVVFASCIARGLRGPGNIVTIMDELAHFILEGNSVSSDVRVYDAITPSTATFNRPDGTVDGKIIMISSPLNRQGVFYKNFEMAIKKEAKNILAIQAPTWEANPQRVQPSYLKAQYKESPVIFLTEFGAQFSDRISGWVEDEKYLRQCVIPELKIKKRGVVRLPHFIGIDLGLVQDNTGIAITHVTEDGKVELDYHKVIPHDDLKYGNGERLDIEKIADLIYELSKVFYIRAGLFDYWNGIAFEQALHKRGLRQIKTENLNRETNSKMYQVVKLLMIDEKLRLYEDEKIIGELLQLRQESLSKYRILVKAPDGYGHFDDFADAFARSVFLASNFLEEGTRVAKLAKHNPLRRMSRFAVSAKAYQRNREKRLRRYNSKRVVPRGRF